MGTVRLICLLFSIFETFGQLNSKENDALQANNLLASTTSGKVSNVLRDILNQESLVRFSMVQKIQSLVMDVADSKNDNEYMKKKLNDVTEKLQALDVKNRQMEDENESLRQELKILSDHYNHTIESLQTLHDKEFLFLKNETSRLQNENDGTTLDAIEIKKELGEFNKAFDYLNLSKGEIKKEFHQNIQGLQMEVEENRNSNQAQKLRLSDVQTLLTEYIQNVNESRTAFQKQIEVMDKRMENLERHGTLNARVQVVEDSLQKFSLSLDDIRADQKVYMNNKHLRRIVTGSSKDCKELYEMGNRTSAIYNIYPWDRYNPKKNPVQVQCDMSTAGGGWTVIQNRVDGKVNFSRSWEEYKFGFGDRTTSYWIGNDVIHDLTKKNDSSLYVSITGKDGTTHYIQYDTFSIAGEDDDYRLFIDGKATGTLDDRIRIGTDGDNINGMKFSTYDKDNDLSSNHCTDLMGVGGWWFNRCNDAYLNGQYPPGTWRDVWHGTFAYGSEISSTMMMIKRK